MLFLRLAGLVALLNLFSVFKVSAQELPVMDNDFSCIQKSVADQYVRDFSINIQSFGGMELCNAKVETKKLFNDLTLIQAGTFNVFGSNPSNPLIKGFLQADQYYKWMKQQTRGIDRGQDVPYATAYNRGGYFTMQDGWTQLSTLGRVGTVVHEARHTQGYTHISCNQGPYAGTGLPGCDRDYSYGGSHGIEMEYYARVSALGTNFHPLYKKMARLMAMGRANFVFNTTPLKQREALFMIGQSGRGYVQDHPGDDWRERETPPLGNHQLKRSSFGATLFDGLNAFALDPYQNSGFNLAVKDDYSYFKLVGSDRESSGKAYADFEEVDLGRKRYVVGLYTNDTLSKFNFKDGAFSPAVRAPSQSRSFATVSPSGQPGLFIIDSSSQYFSYDPERMVSTKINEILPPGVIKFVKTPAGFYRLGQAGDLEGIEGGKFTKIATPEPVRQIVAIPLYDSFEVTP